MKFDGVEDKDRKVGVMAAFLNESGKRKNKHWWCVCDKAPKGHWVSTQGNHTDHSLSHPNALMDGYSISSKSSSRRGVLPPSTYFEHTSWQRTFRDGVDEPALF